MFSAPDAPAPSAMNRIAAKDLDRVQRHRCHQQTDQRGKHDQRHHARLQKLHIIAEPRLAGASAVRW
jgi:hypothetical protein